MEAENIVPTSEEKILDEDTAMAETQNLPQPVMKDEEESTEKMNQHSEINASIKPEAEKEGSEDIDLVNEEESESSDEDTEQSEEEEVEDEGHPYFHSYNDKRDSAIKKQFSALAVSLSGVEANYCYGGAILPAPISAIYVEEIGLLSLPLNEESLIKLKTHAAKAPYGKGSQTIHDLKVRDTWQINAMDVSTPNEPAFFTRTIHLLARQTLKDHFKIDADKMGVEAHLYKMLIYETGGHFTTHRDTEKEPGMFATYLMQIPVVTGFTGGMIDIKLGNQQRQYDFSQDSTNTFHEIVFYADCEHKLHQVQTGWRVVLAFNLIWKKHYPDMTTRQMMVAIPQGLMRTINLYSQIEGLVNTWEQLGFNHQRYIAFPLDHHYTKSNFSFAALKGNDSILAQCFLNCNKLNVSLCLVIKHGEGMEEDLEEEAEVDYDNDWVHSNGNSFAGYNINFATDVIGCRTEEGLFDPDSSPDEQEETGYTGNEGSTYEFWYFKALLVIIPKSFLPFVQLTNDIPAFVQGLLGKCKLQNKSLKILGNAKETKEAKDLFSMLQPYAMHANIPQNQISSLALVAHLLNLHEIRDVFLKRWKQNNLLRIEEVDKVVTLIELVGWEILKPILWEVMRRQVLKGTYDVESKPLYQLEQQLRAKNLLNEANELNEFLETNELTLLAMDKYFQRILPKLRWGNTGPNCGEIFMLDEQQYAEVRRLVVKMKDHLSTIPAKTSLEMFLILLTIQSLNKHQQQQPQPEGSENSTMQDVELNTVSEACIQWMQDNAILQQKTLACPAGLLPDCKDLMMTIIQQLGSSRMKPILNAMWTREANMYAFFHYLLIPSYDCHIKFHIPDYEVIWRDVLRLLLPKVHDLLQGPEASFDVFTSKVADPTCSTFLEILRFALEKQLEVDQIMNSLHAGLKIQYESRLIIAFYRQFILQPVPPPPHFDVSIWQRLHAITVDRLAILQNYAKPTTSWSFPVSNQWYGLTEQEKTFLRSEHQQQMTSTGGFHNITAAQKHATLLLSCVKGITAIAGGSGRSAYVHIKKVDRPHEQIRLQQNMWKRMHFYQLAEQKLSILMKSSSTVPVTAPVIFTPPITGDHTYLSFTAALSKSGGMGGSGSSSAAAMTTPLSSLAVEQPVAKKPKLDTIDVIDLT